MDNKVLAGVLVLVILFAGVFIYKNMETTQTNTSMQNNSNMAENTVNISGFAYSPSTITVKVGETITWTNEDSAPHSATADDGSFDTGLLSQGQSATVTFDKAGTFTYYCTVHPHMKATVIVQ